ncbi:MAG TPA: hypothetical protein VJ840_05645 [Gemmatimonadaceae bacterium]|nr:hypothetical protein [Gemmatimonadaceae bacterium]
MPADDVTARLVDNEQDDIDVIVACAGRPAGLATLQRKIRDLRVLLAPVGTSGERLRELAIEQASGDIVTMVSGSSLGREIDESDGLAF